MKLAFGLPAVPVKLAGVATQAVFAGKDIRRGEFWKRQRPAREARAAQAVRVVLMRAEAEPACRLFAAAQLADHTHARQRRQCGAARDVDIAAQRALAIHHHAPAAENSRAVRHAFYEVRVLRDDLHTVAGGLRVAGQAAVFGVIQPGGFPALHPGVRIDAFHFADADIVIDRRADELIAQSNDLIIQNYYATKLSNLSLKFYNEMLTSGYAKSEDEKQELITRFSDQLLDINIELLNFREKLWYFKAHVWLCFLIQDYRNAYKYAKLWVALFYDHPKMILSHPIWYLKGNSYLFKILLLFKSVDKYIYWNNRLEEQLTSENFPQSENINSQAFLLQFSNKLNIEFIQQTYNGSTIFVKQLQRGINEYSNMIDEHHFHILYFKVASLYFGYKKYEDSLAYTARILANTDYTVQEDLLFHTRILSLMAQFESGQDQHYEDFIKANRNLMKKMKNKTEIHDTFMKLFEGLLGASSKEQVVVLKGFVEKMELLYDNKFYIRSILYIDVLNWAKRKLS